MNTADNDPHTTHHHKSRNTGILIAVIVALTLVAVWLVPEDEPKHADIPLPAAKSGAAPDQAPVQPAVQVQSPPIDEQPEEPEPATEYKEGQEAREFIAKTKQQDTPPNTLFERAEAFQLSGKLADAHLLYFYLARQGHAGACIVLAKQADPAFYSADSSMLDRPYIAQARKWYLAAADAGDSTATELLENLHNHVRTQAAAGDPDANRLLLQWK